MSAVLGQRKVSKQRNSDRDGCRSGATAILCVAKN